MKRWCSDFKSAEKFIKENVFSTLFNQFFMLIICDKSKVSTINRSLDIISMKIVQEENLQSVEHQMGQRYRLDKMSCLFFVLGMMISAYLLHQFIF